MMEELRPEELEELVQELEEESEEEEALSPEVEKLLRDLQPDRRHAFRRRAAQELGEVSRSNRQVVEALAEVAETDSSPAVRAIAAESLRAPVHQAVLQQDADLMKRAQQEAAPRDWKAEMQASLVKPDRLRVETDGDTLSLSWEPEAEQRTEATKNTGWVLLVSALLLVIGISTSRGPLRVVWILVFSLVTLGAVYWIAAVWTNTVRISAGKGEWIFQRGPLPIPNRQFYMRPKRLDPAACQWIWIDREERYKIKSRGSSWGSSGSLDGALGCLVGLIEIGALLGSIERELVVTYKLYARCADGSDWELLSFSSKREAEYLEQTLQGQLDARDGQPAQR